MSYALRLEDRTLADPASVPAPAYYSLPMLNLLAIALEHLGSAHNTAIREGLDLEGLKADDETLRCLKVDYELVLQMRADLNRFIEVDP